MNLFDLFTPQKKTWLYRVNPAVKFVLFFLLFMVVFFNQNYLFTMNIMIMSGLLLFLFSGYRLRRLLLFSIPVVVSIFSTAFMMILFGIAFIIWWQCEIIKICVESFDKGL